jgi:hypothetical protein
MISDLPHWKSLKGAATFAASTTAFAVRGRAATDDLPVRPMRGDKGASIIGADEPRARITEQRPARTNADGSRDHPQSVVENIPTRKTPVAPV